MAKSLFDLREAWETSKGIEIKRKANTDIEEAAPKISTGKAKGAISATGLRGKGMKKFDVDVSVKNGKFEFRIKDEQGKFQTVGLKQAARMLGESVDLAEAKEPASPDEGSMAVRQLEFMYDAIEDIMEHIEEGGDFPEWMQNKLTEAHTKIKDLYASVEGSGDDDEEEDEDDVKESTEHLQELDAKTQQKFSIGAKNMKAYAQKNGGVDKKDFMEIAKLLDQISRVNLLQAGQILSRLNRLVDGMDTDVRERVYAELKKVGLVEQMKEARKYTPPTKAEIEADKRKDRAGKPRPSMTAKSATKKQYGNYMGGLKKEETVSESDAAYAKSMEKEKEKRLTKNDQNKLAKIRAMMAKERGRKSKK